MQLSINNNLGNRCTARFGYVEPDMYWLIPNTEKRNKLTLRQQHLGLRLDVHLIQLVP